MFYIFLIFAFRFHLDPSGTFIEYDAKAIGSGSEGAQHALEEAYHKVHYVNGIVISQST